MPLSFNNLYRSPGLQASPGLYVGTKAEEDDGIPFKEKRERLKNRLEKQFIASNELQEKI